MSMLFSSHYRPLEVDKMALAPYVAHVGCGTKVLIYISSRSESSDCMILVGPKSVEVKITTMVTIPPAQADLWPGPSSLPN
jgi:hypothetical protein